MAYNRFTLSEAKKVFQLITNESRDLFSAAAAVEISDFLRQTLERNLSLGDRYQYGKGTIRTDCRSSFG